MKKTTWFLIIILIAAAAVRLYNLAAISMWHDEAFSALLINYPWHEMFYRIGLDVHPPLYYILLRFWADLFGHSLFALRGFSAFFGVAAVYATYLFVKSAFEREDLALAAALLMALNPFEIQYVTEARMYTFGTFAIMISAYFLVEAFKAQRALSAGNAGGRKRVWTFWLLFAAATSASIYTHYYMFFSALAIGLFALYYLYKNYRFSLRQWQYFLYAYALVFLSYVPWLKTFVFQFKQVQNSYWIPKPTIWSVPLTVYEMLLGTGADASKHTTQIMLVIVCLFSLYMLWRVIRKWSLPTDGPAQPAPNVWLVILGLVIPFVGSLALSLKQSIFLDRYFLFAALFYTIALAMFIFSMPARWLKYSLLGLAAVVALYTYTNNWKNLNVAAHPGMAAAAAYLNNNVAGKDKLYVASSYEFFNFKYYNKTGHAALLYSPPALKDLVHFSGTALLTENDLLHSWNADTKHGDTVWVLWTTGFGGTRPDTPSNWLPLTGGEHVFPDVRPYVGTDIIVDEFVVK